MAEATLNVKVTETGAATVQKNIAAIGKEAASAGYSVRSLDHLLGVLGAGFVVGKFAEFADEWQNIHNKLLSVTSDTQNLNAVNEALFAGAQKSRTAYGEFVNVYQELAIQSQRFGTSQQQMVDMVTTMEQAAQLAHPSLAAMKAGVEQLILSMERGQLQTRGFSALLKDTPQLAQAIADGLGISINKMRELAHHGQITAAEIVGALEKAGPEVAQKFLKLQPTIEGAMTVLHNGWIKFIGDLDASTGIIGGITNLIIGMSNHMDVLAATLVVFGALATAVFANLARKAILSMWTALVAAGPVAWAIAALATIAGMVVIFGDKVAVTKDGMVTLLDYIKGAFESMGDLFSALGDWIAGVWQSIGPEVTSALSGLGEAQAAYQDSTMAGFKAVVNFIIASFVFAYKTITTTFSDLPAALGDTFISFFNWVEQKWGALINGIITGINKISAFAGMGQIGAYTPQQMANPYAGAADRVHKDVRDSFGAFGTDYVGEAGAAAGRAVKFVNDTIMKHAREASARRRSATGIGAVGTDHGDAEPDDGTGKKKKKGGKPPKTRQDYIDEEVQKYRDQLRDASDVSVTPWTEAAVKEVTKFNDELMKHTDKKGRHFPGLSPEEKKSMLDLIQGYEDANRVQKERFAILEQAVGPQVKYNDAIKAATQLEGAHMITAQQAAKAERDAAIAYLSTKTDEASGKMLGQLEILQEMQDRAKPLADAMKSVWDAQVGPLLTLQTTLTAVNTLLEKQLITAERARVAVRDAEIAYFDTQTDAASGVTRALLKIQKAAEDAASSMEQTINDAFQGLEDAWVGLATGQKVDVKGIVKTLQTDLAKQSFAPIKDWLASTALSKFGVSIPGLAGKVGESAANPMWVKSVDGALSGLGNAGGGLGSLLGNPLAGIGSLGDALNADFSNTPLLGDTTSWTDSFNSFDTSLNANLNTTFTQASVKLGDAVGAGISMLGNVIGNKVGGVGGAIIDILGTVGGAFVGHYMNTGSWGFATGGGFTVGGDGGTDSQVVQFRASPGERVNIDRGGAPDSGQQSGGNYYYIDARGASEMSIEDRIDKAMAKALPAAEKKTRMASMQDITSGMRRQTLPGGR